MNELVVDTSVAFKWFIAYGENGLDAAAALLLAHRQGEVELIAPSTITVELANTLCCALADTEDALGLLAEFESTSVSLYETSPGLVRAAMLRAGQVGLSIYDALFLALAEEHDCPLVTADRKAFEGIESTVEIRLL